jgi:SAM-dependent methyltransferase
MTPSPKSLTNLYRSLEADLPFAEPLAGLSEATAFAPNRSKPVHGWFRFKEGFSADLMSVLELNERHPSEQTVFIDPFAGCGTTLLAADLEHGWRCTRIGFEINPFLAFVTRTKLAWRSYSPDRLARLADEVLSSPLGRGVPEDDWPPLSTLHNREMFLPNRVSNLLDAVERVQAIEAPEREALLLGVAAVAEQVGFYRKDGRALRVLREDPELETRRCTSVATALRMTWARYADDLRVVDPLRDRERGPVRVVEGDGRLLSLPLDLHLSDGSADLLVYSPPYLNHIDYTEVYKVELWLLGFVSKQQEMLDLRRRTLRSHASIRIDESVNEFAPNVAEAIDLASTLIATSGSAWHRSFARLGRAYLADMQESFKNQLKLLKPGGTAVCVVGNSAHGGRENRIPIATDLLLAETARFVGFEVRKMSIARRTIRRDPLNGFIRETALILQRPFR